MSDSDSIKGALYGQSGLGKRIPLQSGRRPDSEANLEPHPDVAGR